MNKKLTYFLLGLIFILASLPVLRPGIFKMHDFTHGARIAEMTRALNDGHFPVRWSQNFGFGYGMPLFQFYGPLPFYIGGIVYWLSNNLILSVKSLFLFCNLLTLTGGYLLGKKLFKNEWSGLITSLILTLAPYRALNLYVRGAVSEAWGIMAVPWILWAVIKIIRQEKFGEYWLIVWLSVLFLSHNLSVLIFTPFLLCFSLFLIWLYKIKRGWSVKNALGAVKRLIWPSLFSIALSGFYLIPSFFEKDLTQVRRFILGDYFRYFIHFLYIRQFFESKWGFGGSQWGPDDPISFFLGWGQCLVIGLTVVFLIIFAVRKLYLKQKINYQEVYLPIFLLISLGAYLLFTTHKTQFIWDNISLLEFVQFPWRFLAGPVVIIAILAGWVVKKAELLLKRGKLVKAVLISVLTAGLINAIYFRAEEYLATPTSLYYADEIKIRTDMSYILPDYISTALSAEIEPALELILSQHELEENSLQVVVDRTHEKLVRTNFPNPQDIEIAVAAYPGWLAQLNQEKPFEPQQKNGHLVVEVPAGEQLLSIMLRPTNLRLISDLISLGSLIILLVIGFKKYELLKND